MKAKQSSLAVLRVALPIVILVVAGLGLKALIDSREVPKREPKAPQLPLVETMELLPTEHVVRVRGSGVVRASVRSELTAQVGGRVEFVSPKLRDGMPFDENELLLRIESSDYEAALAQSKAGLEAARLALAQTEKDASLAREEWERMKLDREPDPLLLRIPQLSEARARLEAARLALRKSELDVERCEIRAPYAGRVLVRHADLGEVLQPGMRIAEIHSTESSELRMPLHDSELEWLGLPGTLVPSSLAHKPKVTLKASFGGVDNTWYGYVDRVAGELDPTTRMVELVVRVPNPYRADASGASYVLPLGLFAAMEIEGKKLDNVFRIPRSALRRGSQILLVDDEDRIHLQEIDVLVAQDGHVLTRGLRPGSQLCLTPIDLPIEGMRVRRAGGADR